MSNYSDPINATGSLITFDAPAGGIFDSLSVPITPTQDLHGYDHPWPGGGNINRLPPNATDGTETKNGVTITAENGVYTLSGTATATTTFTFSLSQSFNLSPSTNKICFLNTERFGSVLVGFVRNGTRIHYWGMTPVNRVASGWTDTGNEYVDSIKIEIPNGTTFSTPLVISPVFMDKNSTSVTVFTPYSNICPISGIDNLSVYVSPTTQQAQATTYNVSFGAAGTVYGGTVDVVTGVLTVTHSSIEYDGSSDESWAVYSSPRFYIKRADFTSPGNSVVADIKTNRLQVIAKQAMGSTNYRFSASDSGSHQFMIRVDSSVNTVALLRTWLSNNPLQVVYKLTTPLTYQLTPTQISALVGSNNVWVDISAVITLIYRLLQVDRQTGATSIGRLAQSLTIANQFGAYSRVIVNVTEELYYEAGNDTGRTLELTCPFGNQTMANNILAMLEGFQYQPYTAECAIIDPAAELGDGLTVNGVYGGIFRFCIKSGAVYNADVSAPADEEIDHEYAFIPNSERKIERRLANISSELSVQAGEIAAKVDREGGDPSSVSWKMDADLFKVAVDGSDVLTVDENGLTVNGNGSFTGEVQAKNITYGGSSGTFSGGGITGGSIGTSRLSSGINESLGNADFSADVFSGATTASWTKAYNIIVQAGGLLRIVGSARIQYGSSYASWKSTVVKDSSGNNITIHYLGF